MLSKSMLLRNNGFWVVFEMPDNNRFQAITQFSFRNKAFGMHGKFFIWANIESQKQDL